MQVKTGSEKGWDSLQLYIKRIGHTEDDTDEARVDGMGGDKNGAHDNYDGYSRGEEGGEVECDVGDLLGFEADSSEHAQHVEGEEEVEEHKKHRKKKSKMKEAMVDENPSLISFDDDSAYTTTASSKTTSTSLSLSATAQASTKSRTQESRSSGGGGGGYGSTGNNWAAVGSTLEKDDLSGNWGEDWSGGDIATTPVVSGGGGDGWDEDWDEGWSSVDLQSKAD